MRLIRASKDGRATEVVFTLMEPDKRTAYQLYAILNVDDIHALRHTPDVVWNLLPPFPRRTDQRRDGTRENHGPAASEGLADAKLPYKSLRSQLADLANERLAPVSPPSDGE